MFSTNHLPSANPLSLRVFLGVSFGQVFGYGEEGVVEYGGAGDGVASADGFEDGLNVVVELGHKHGGGFVRLGDVVHDFGA